MILVERPERNKSLGRPRPVRIILGFILEEYHEMI
jgi:hypothetical protein